MLVRRVIGDEIEQDADATFVGFGEQAVEILQGAVHRVDVFVIRDVVAEVHLRRRKAWSDPDRIDADLFQIVEL